MTTVPVINYKRTFIQNKQAFELNITARNLDGFPPAVQTLMIVRTVNAWLYIARAIQNNLRQLDEKFAFRSVESSIEEEPIADSSYAFDPAPEARVTVFDWNRQLDLTMHSHSLPQPTLDLYWAMQDAKEELKRAFPDTSIPRQDAPPQNAAPAQGTSTPNAANGASNDGVVPLLTKKEAIAKLPAGSPFKMKVVQLEKHSKDGKDFYDFFEPWGGKAGQYSSKTVYADNEIAVNSGLIAYLETMGIQLGQALTGNWIVNATVGKPKTKTFKGEEKTFTDIYINSFEGQPKLTNDPNGVTIGG